MFGLGMPEILLILAIALIVIGPKKLPELAKTLGRAMGEFKRSAQDFKNSIDMETTVKDFSDLDKPSPSLREAVKSAQSDNKDSQPPTEPESEPGPPENTSETAGETSEEPDRSAPETTPPDAPDTENPDRDTP